METDYSQLSEKDFIHTLQELLAFKIKNPESINKTIHNENETKGFEADFVMIESEIRVDKQEFDSKNNSKINKPKWKQLTLF